MPKAALRTAADVIAITPRATLQRWWMASEPGLVLRVMPSGSRAWYHEYSDAMGKRQAVKLGDAATMTPADARKAKRALGADPAQAKRDAKAAAAEAARRALTLDTFLGGPDKPGKDTWWLLHLSGNRAGASGLVRLRKAWPTLLSKPLASLTPLDVERVRRARQKAGISRATLDRDWTELRAALNGARRLGLMDAVPEVQRLGQHDNSRVRFLSDDERARFLAALDAKGTAPHMRLLARLIYFTGMRRGEALALDWRDVDFAGGRITVRAENAKTARARHVPLHPALRAVLEPVAAKSGLVVESPNGGALADPKTAWRGLMARAKISDFRLHDLRHDFASRLVMGGTDLLTVRDLLGHTTIQLTERYAHIAPDRHATAVAALA
jgi:integrase